MFNYWKIYSDKHLYRKWRARKFIEIIPFAILRYCHSQTHTHMLAFSFNAPHSTPCLLLTLGKVIYVYRRNTNSQNMFYTWWKGMRVCKIGIMKPEDKMLQIWHLKKKSCELWKQWIRYPLLFRHFGWNDDTITTANQHHPVSATLALCGDICVLRLPSFLIAQVPIFQL